MELQHNMVSYIDSHVHLADPSFADDVDAVIQRARASGARALVCIGESPAAALRAQRIAQRYPDLVYHTCGVHPHDAASWDDVRDAESIREALAAGAVAVGECGLDYHYDHSPRDVQRTTLNAQLRLAAELQRPVVLHTREAEADTISMLRDAASAGIRGVLHCFTGSHALADAGLEAGWYVSFSGVITFKKWSDHDLLRRVPDDRVLVESDAPYLAPVPHRGARNEPAYVPRTIAVLAAARERTVEVMSQVTQHNAEQLFHLPPVVLGVPSSH